MARADHRNAPCWFVLNHCGPAFQNMARKAVDRFNVWQNSKLELFAPTYVVREQKDGRTTMRMVNLTFHYVFVRGTLDEVKHLCAQENGFSLLIDRGNDERYATVADSVMAGFMNVARAYSNCLPYYPLDDIDLEAGDLVEVVNGDFPGLTGIYMPRTGSNSGNIILHIYNKVGTIAFDVRATDVRVLEFSHKSTRANDQIDAFVPQLLKALRHYSAGETLPTSLIAKLTVFCRRMERVRLNNRKLEAKLRALLAAASHILGDMNGAESHRRRYDAYSSSVTNPWTQALVSLIFAVIDGTAVPPCPVAEAASRTRLRLAEEYAHYRHQ